MKMIKRVFALLLALITISGMTFVPALAENKTDGHDHSEECYEGSLHAMCHARHMAQVICNCIIHITIISGLPPIIAGWYNPGKYGGAGLMSAPLISVPIMLTW